MKFKSLLGGMVTAALLSSAAFAAETAKTLPAGKPAGTEKATLMGVDVGLLGVLAVGTLAIIAVAGGFNAERSTTGTGA